MGDSGRQWGGGRRRRPSCHSSPGLVLRSGPLRLARDLKADKELCVWTHPECARPASQVTRGRDSRQWKRGEGREKPFPQSLRAACSKTPPHGSSMSWIPPGSNLPSRRVHCVGVGQGCGQWAGADGRCWTVAGMEPCPPSTPVHCGFPLLCSAPSAPPCPEQAAQRAGELDLLRVTGAGGFGP